MASRVPVPPRSFDDQLESLIAFLKQSKTALVGVDPKQLESDLKAQREERKKDHDAERQYEQIHRRFLESQAERYRRFGVAVQVMRAANRHNADVLAAMEQFKRPRTATSAKKSKADKP